MPTLHDVAKQAGVSSMTVSRVVNGSPLVGPDTRARVEAVLAETGYMPNMLARGLRSKRTDTIALLLPDMTNPFFTTLAHGVEAAARERSVTMILANSDEDEDEEVRLIRVLIQLDLRPEDPDVDVVRADSETGSIELGRLLVSLGHRDMAILTGPPSTMTAAVRAIGFRRALVEDAGLPEPIVIYGTYTIDGGHAATLEAMRATPRPTALFGANNFIALGALRALRELGLRVPDDVAVVSFDDLPEAMVTFPFLTVSAQPAAEIGRRGVTMLLDRLADPDRPYREVVLPTQLVIRRSSGGPVTPGRG